MILVINTGSSSLKFKLFNPEGKVAAEEKFANLRNFADYRKSLIKISKQAKDLALGLDNIKVVAHRVVHGGELESPYIIKNWQALRKIEKYSPLAPLHNPVALRTIRQSQTIFPKAKQIAVFDTSFYNNLPILAQTLPINYLTAKKFGIKKYGFHGINHRYAVSQVDPANKYKILSLHLGAGSSITAINCGKALDTTMSFTPLDGLVMQTRSGSIDPGVIFYLIRKMGLRATEDIIIKRSGLAGLSGTNGDMKTLLYCAGLKVEDKNFDLLSLPKPKSEVAERAKSALNKYVYEIKKHLAALDAVLDGADMIVFTGEIGYGSSLIRQRIIKDTSQFKSKKFFVVKPNEELAIFNTLNKKS